METLVRWNWKHTWEKEKISMQFLARISEFLLCVFLFWDYSPQQTLHILQDAMNIWWCEVRIIQFIAEWIHTKLYSTKNKIPVKNILLMWLWKTIIWLLNLLLLIFILVTNDLFIFRIYQFKTLILRPGNISNINRSY